MSEPVAGTHAHQRDLWPGEREKRPGDRTGAAVMADLDHLDIADRAPRCERFEHHALGVAGEQNPARTGTLDQKHHARFVVRRSADRRRRREDSHRERPHASRPTRTHLAHGRAHACGVLDEVTPGSGSHDQPLGAQRRAKRAEPACVVGVQMRQHDVVHAADVLPGQRIAQGAFVRATVHEQRRVTIAHEHRVSLAHIEHADARARGRPCAARHDAHQQARGRHTQARPRCRGGRPEAPHGDGEGQGDSSAQRERHHHGNRRRGEHSQPVGPCHSGAACGRRQPVARQREAGARAPARSSHRPAEPCKQYDGHQRTSHDVCRRCDERHDAERRDRDRRGRGLRGQCEREGLCEEPHSVRHARFDPCGHESREQHETRHRCDRELEPHIERGRRPCHQKRADRRRECGTGIGAATRAQCDGCDTRHEPRTHRRRLHSGRDHVSTHDSGDA